MDVEEQIRRIFDNEISYNIVYNSGIQDDISFIIEDDTFLVGDLRSTITWSLVGQHVVLYVELLNEKNRYNTLKDMRYCIFLRFRTSKWEVNSDLL